MTFLLPPLYLEAVDLALDASDSWGCAAWHDTWRIQIHWDDHVLALLIVAKELLPIVMAAATWGPLS